MSRSVTENKKNDRRRTLVMGEPKDVMSYSRVTSSPLHSAGTGKATNKMLKEKKAKKHLRRSSKRVPAEVQLF